MADRVAVFNDGRIVQVGVAARRSTSGRRPASSPISSAVQRPRRRRLCDAGPGRRGRRASGRRRSGCSSTAPRTPAGAIGVEGTVAQVLYQGATTRIEIAAAIGPLVAALPAAASPPAAEGAAVRAACARAALHPHGRRDEPSPRSIPRAAREACFAALSDVFLRRRGFYLLLLLVPPLLWLGVVYLGSLFALLAAELLLDRRFFRPGRPRADACRPTPSCCRRPISTSSCAPSRWPRR